MKKETEISKWIEESAKEYYENHDLNDGYTYNNACLKLLTYLGLQDIENPKEWVDKVKKAQTAIDITNALLGFLTHVGNEEKPFTSRIQMFNSKMDAADIILWACKADVCDSPIQRVIELRKELTETQAELIKLKAELKAVFEEQAGEDL
jgi:hypothetical protein